MKLAAFFLSLSIIAECNFDVVTATNDSGVETGGLALITAIQDNNFTALDSILQERPHLNSALITVVDEDEDENGGRTTPLHCAIKFNTLEMARHLIEKHGSNVNVANGLGATTLGFAVHRNASVDMLTLLLDHGGDYLIEYRDFSGKTPLQTAVVNGNLATVRLLLARKALPDDGDDNNCTRPLLSAVQLKASVPACTNLTSDEAFVDCQRENGQIFLAIAEELVKSGANPHLIDFCTSQSPIELARRYNDRQMMQLFGISDTPSPVRKLVTKKFNRTGFGRTTTKRLTLLVALQEIELFDLFAESRCSGDGISRGGGHHFDNVRMISAEECAFVCEELPQCFGFNLIVTPSTGSRGNGCIITTGPCQLYSDIHFAYYRKKPFAPAPPAFTINLLGAGGVVPPPSLIMQQTAKRSALATTSTTTAQSVAALFPQQNDYLPPLIAAGPSVAVARSPGVHHNNLIYPNSNPFFSPNPFFQQQQQQQQKQQQQPQLELPNDMMQNSIARKVLLQQPINSCGKIPWFGWLLIGVFSGLIGATSVSAFIFCQWKQSYMLRNMNDITGLTSSGFNFHHTGLIEQQPPAIKSSINSSNKSHHQGGGYTIEPIGICSKPPIAANDNKKSSLNFTATSCWSSNIFAEIEEAVDTMMKASSENNSNNKATTNLPPYSSSNVASRNLQKKRRPLTADDDSVSKSNNNYIKKNHHQMAKKSGGAVENSLPLADLSGLPPLVQRQQRRRSSLKGIHKVDVEWPPTSSSPVVVAPAPFTAANGADVFPLKMAPSHPQPDVDEEEEEEEKASNHSASDEAVNKSYYEEENDEEDKRVVTADAESVSKAPAPPPPLFILSAAYRNGNIKGVRSDEDLTKTSINNGTNSNSKQPRECWIDYRELFASAAVKLAQKRAAAAAAANSCNNNNNNNNSDKY